MPQTYATMAGEAFAKQLLRNYIATSCAREVTNREYEGELKRVGDTVHLPNIQVGDWTQASGDLAEFLSWNSLNEQPSTMTADQYYQLQFAIGDYARVKSWIKNPESSALADAGRKLQVMVDKSVFGLYDDAASGNWIGTSYTTGTVAVAATTGAVTGTGTTFTADMVGKPFKAAGQTKWYRVKTYTSATSITIEDDLDDVASAYTGGAITAGATYEIQANTPVTVTSNGAGGTMAIWDLLMQVKTVFDVNNIPQTDRAIVLPPALANKLTKAEEIDRSRLSVDVIDRLKLKGYIGEYLGLTIYSSNNLTQDGSGNFYALAAHKGWCTMGMALNESRVCEIEKGMGYGYKSLALWGRKVPDVRRTSGICLYLTVGNG